MVDLFMYRDPEAKKAIDTAVGAEDEDVEVAEEDAAVQNTMKKFEGQAAEEEDEGDEEDEKWGQTAGAGDYAKWAARPLLSPWSSLAKEQAGGAASVLHQTNQDRLSMNYLLSLAKFLYTILSRLALFAWDLLPLQLKLADSFVLILILNLNKRVFNGRNRQTCSWR